MASMSEGPKTRWRFRFSLRTLLVAFIVACAAVGWISAKLEGNRQRNLFWTSLFKNHVVKEIGSLDDGPRYFILRDGSFTDDDVRSLRRFYPEVVIFHHASDANRNNQALRAWERVVLPEDQPISENLISD